MQMDKMPDKIDPCIEELRLCISRLSRSHARMRLLAIASCVLFAVTLMIGLRSPDRSASIECNEITVIDKSGRKRMWLGVDGGQPGLVLFDSHGRPRAALGIAPPYQEPSLGFFTSQGIPSLAIGQFKKGPALTMAASNGKPALAVECLAQGSVITLNDDDGKNRIKLGVTDAGPAILLMDKSGSPVWNVSGDRMNP